MKNIYKGKLQNTKVVTKDKNKIQNDTKEKIKRPLQKIKNKKRLHKVKVT